jgi:hypothetical protein
VFVPRLLRRIFPVVLGLLVAVAIAPTGATASPAHPAGGPATPSLVPLGVVPCSGPEVPANYSGTLAVEGGPLASSAATDVPLGFSYFEEDKVNYVRNGTLASENCTRESGTVRTNASAGFAVHLTTPAENCTLNPSGGEECTTYFVPFGPFSIATVDVPAGYALSVEANGTGITLAWVAEFARVSLSPGPPLATFASGGSWTFAAVPESANGSVSPLAPNDSWALTGSDFRFSAPPAGASAVVAAGPGWANGTLTVGAAVTVGPNTFVAPNVSIALAAVPTALAATTLNRTVVDLGGTVALNVSATGAAGYRYSLSIAPEPALAPADGGCSTRAIAGAPSTVDVECLTDLAFASAGNVSVAVNLSNGASAASWLSPNVTVVAPPTVVLAPAAPAGYAGRPIPVDLLAGSGVAPYAAACLAPGVGPRTCFAGAGPVFAFAPTYSAAGNYSARAWLVDATGTNRSLTVRVEVADPLALGAVSLGNASPAAGVLSRFSVPLAGGLLPAKFWWNSSGSTAPIAAGVADADGALAATYAPPAAGSLDLSVTVVDALGTRVEANLNVAVGPGPVARVVPVPAAAGSAVTVGRPDPIAWQAYDALGEPIGAFAAPVDLVVRSSAGTAALAWVNLSRLGPLSAAPVGSFAIPASAWTGGELPLTFTAAEAGVLTLALEGSALPGGVAVRNVSAAPDLEHLRLFAPSVAVAGVTVNRTFWHVSDRFGDPVPGALVTVQLVTPGSAVDTLLPVETEGEGGTGVWVNFSLPTGSDGTVRVLDLAGDLLYGPVRAPTPAVVSGPLVTLELAVVAGALGAGTVGGSIVHVRRRRAERPAPRSDEEELRRLAEGRAEAVEIVRSLGVADLAALRAAWTDEAPSETELGEWLASLVADGTLSTAAGPTGEPEYALAPATAPEGPRVVVDAEALERAVAARDAAVRDDGPLGTG